MTSTTAIPMAISTAIKTTMATEATAARPRRVIGAIAAMLLALTACGDSSISATTTASVAPTTTAPSPTPPDDDAARLFADAVAAVGDSYAFASTVVANGSEVTSVEGSLHGDRSSYVIRSGGSTLEYIVSSEGRWVRPPGGDWVTLGEPVPFAQPLAALASPLSLEVLSRSTEVTVLQATYEGATLGFTNGEMVVTITVVAGVLTRIEYTVPFGEDGTFSTVVTVIDAAADVPPITLPGG